MSLSRGGGGGGEAEHALAGVNEKHKMWFQRAYLHETTGPSCHSACVKWQPSHVSDVFRAPAAGRKNDSFVEDTVTALTGHMTPLAASAVPLWV